MPRLLGITRYGGRIWSKDPETGGDILRRDNKANNYSGVFPEEGVHCISMVEQYPVTRIGAMSPGQPVLRHYYQVLSWWRKKSVQFSLSVVSDSLRPHGLQHARPPCPSPIPRAYSDSCPLSW